MGKASSQVYHRCILTTLLCCNSHLHKQQNKKNKQRSALQWHQWQEIYLNINNIDLSYVSCQMERITISERFKFIWLCQVLTGCPWGAKILKVDKSISANLTLNCETLRYYILRVRMVWLTYFTAKNLHECINFILYD